ncbi:hypothetical protein [Algoriphagus antarcticus]|uniref:Uncharacterized protein n=1 Tax=Algoriphagus antarcticus TaxID=238540 RepID=A0A3E0DXJ4_9BACT|nr:hypothetical protein [Algoriphagus antarcticus]REG88713.1 hypothetical protein C8N25_108148 [Algoriphagus antarcticus]
MEINAYPTAAPSSSEFITEGIIWFSVRNRKEVNSEIGRLKSQGISRLRLGIDCAEFNTKKGIKWYDWLLPTLAESFELELCFDNFSKTPNRSLSRTYMLPEIVEHFILKHGEHFNLLELWRNPANRAKHESSENIFSEDVVFAATWAKHLGKKVSLGRIQTTDFEWIATLVSSQFLKNIECVEIDKEGENLRNTSTQFYERTLRSLFEAKGVKTKIRPSSKSSPNQQLGNKEIAC